MVGRGKALALAVVILAALAEQAHGDPATDYPPAPPGLIHLKVPSKLETDKGTKLRLPPSYVFDEPSFQKLDDEHKQLETDKVRLTAENKSLRDSAAHWKPAWYWIASATVAGIAIGWSAHKL